MTDEAPQALGGTNAGTMRVGQTVRRKAGRWTPVIHAVMAYLAASDYPVQRVLGVDGEFEVLEWTEGNADWEQHHRLWSDDARLVAVARLLRRLHDLLDQFEIPADARWRSGWGRDESTVGPLCHHDFAPWNVLVQPGGGLVVIDMDGIAPGDRLAELAYAACGFVPLRWASECERIGWTSPPDFATRLEAFYQGYGADGVTREELASAIVVCAEGGVRFGVEMHRQGREPFASLWARDNGQGDRDDLEVTRAAAAAWLRRFG